MSHFLVFLTSMLPLHRHSQRIALSQHILFNACILINNKYCFSVSVCSGLLTLFASIIGRFLASLYSSPSSGTSGTLDLALPICTFAYGIPKKLISLNLTYQHKSMSTHHDSLFSFSQTSPRYKLFLLGIKRLVISDKLAPKPPRFSSQKLLEKL